MLKKANTTLDLARLALDEGKKLAAMASSLAGTATEDYAAALKEKRVLTPVDHPDPAHCIITGTGLTHLGSAAARDGMHKKLSGAAEDLTDSLKMFKMGLEGGKPKAKGEAGVQPEWFYKGDGSWLVAPGQPLPKPSFALDGGEEPELAGLYMIDAKGKPGAPGLRARQRIFRPCHRAAELSLSRALETAPFVHRSGDGDGQDPRQHRRHEPHRAQGPDRSGRSRS